jgi:hypothetical protein
VEGGKRRLSRSLFRPCHGIECPYPFRERGRGGLDLDPRTRQMSFERIGTPREQEEEFGMGGFRLASQVV